MTIDFLENLDSVIEQDFAEIDNTSSLVLID
jgi:hypothetical protein